MRQTFFIILLLLIISSCSNSNDNSDISIISGNNTILVANNTNETIYFHTISKKLQPLALWFPHTEDDKSIQPNSRIILSLEDIDLLPEENELIFYYWTSLTTNSVKSKNIILN